MRAPPEPENGNQFQSGSGFNCAETWPRGISPAQYLLKVRGQNELRKFKTLKPNFKLESGNLLLTGEPYRTPLTQTLRVNRTLGAIIRYVSQRGWGQRDRLKGVSISLPTLDIDKKKRSDLRLYQLAKMTYMLDCQALTHLLTPVRTDIADTHPSPT